MSKLREMDLMDKILGTRYSDLEEKKELCLQLLDLAEGEQHTYGIAFANVYLMESSLALGESDNCDVYLSRAVYLCRENGFDDLLLTICDLGGMYYLKLNDEQAALEYFLEGLKIARSLNDFGMSSKLNNNIGLAFGGRGGWSTAKHFFDKAYREMRISLKNENDEMITSYVVNLSECYKEMGDIEKEKEALDILKGLPVRDLYTKIRIACGWCSYYVMCEDRKKAIEKLQEVLALGIQEYENTYFVQDVLVCIAENMLQIKEYGWMGRVLTMLDQLGKDVPLIVQYRIQRLRIQYLKANAEENKLAEAYKQYHKIVEEMGIMDSQIRGQSMLSRIQLEQSLKDRESIKTEKKALENASQMDELTRVYNRRYLNKLISKAIQNNTLDTIGIVMVDVDYFKQYNDTYGHFQGDKALKTVASILKNHTMEGIHAGRYGGDEFVAACINVSDEKVDSYVAAVYQGLKEANVVHAESKCSERLTISMGYCNIKAKNTEDVNHALQLADDALYKVKQAGRNGFQK